MSRSRQITVIILIMLTAVLAGVAIYVGMQVTQEDTSPDDSSADTIACGRVQCKDGREAGHQCDSIFSSCEARAAEFCGGADNVQSANIDVDILCNTNGQNPQPTEPTLQCNNGSNGGTGCLIFICPNGCGGDGRCEGNDQGVQIFTESGSCNATLDGRCGQIDIVADPRVDSANPGFQCVKEITCGTPACNPQPRCGDGNVNTGEQCDDGNTTSGDGCSSTCQEEESDPGTFTVSTFCTEQNNLSVARVTWSPGSTQGQGDTRVRVDTDPNFAQGDGFWQRQLDEGSRNVNIPNEFVGTAGQNGTIRLTPGQTYYVRVVDVDSSQFYTSGGAETASFVAQQCAVEGCGDPCSSNTQCPNDHVCSNGTCQLQACIGNASCTQNGCVLPLPNTAIFGEQYDKLLLGAMFIILGMLFVKFNIFSGIMNMTDYVGKFQIDIDSPRKTINPRLKRSRKNFEKKFKK